MQRTRILSLAAVLATLAAALPAAAQEQPRKGATVSGRVVDALTGQGVPHVSIKIPALSRTAITNAEGYFVLEDLEPGEHEWSFDRIGYALLRERTETKDGDRFTVSIMPRPQVLEALVVTVDVLDRQRRRIAVPVRAVEGDDILRSGISNPVELLESSAGVRVLSCGEELCVRNRGGSVLPTVYIDEVPTFRGLHDLRVIPAMDLYVLESYDNGSVVRAYTRNFMEYLARRGRHPRDIQTLAMYHRRPGTPAPRP